MYACCVDVVFGGIGGKAKVLSILVKTKVSVKLSELYTVSISQLSNWYFFFSSLFF
jgi:hypothetical protein